MPAYKNLISYTLSYNKLNNQSQNNTKSKTMKKSIFLVAVMLICFGIKTFAGNPDDICYVKTADKVYFGQDIKMGLVYTKVISADGTVAKLKTKITEFKGSDFLNDKFKKHFENGLAKSFFNEKEILQIIEETGKYIELENFKVSEIEGI